MAKILRGKDKNKEVIISQWCNDWVSTKEGKVFLVTALEFTDKEVFDILQHQNNGIMLDEFEKIPYKNRFRRKKREN